MHTNVGRWARTFKRQKWTRSLFGKLAFSMHELTWSLFANHTRLVSTIAAANWEMREMWGRHEHVPNSVDPRFPDIVV